MLQVMESQMYYAATRFNGGPRSSYPRPPIADNKDSFIRMRCILKNQLNQGQLSNMPAGFPFHYVQDMQGSALLSEGPYEFRQETVCPSSGYGQHPNQPQASAIVSFTDPATSLRSRGCNKYVWRISLPSFDASNHPDDRVISAEVQVDTQVMLSPYGSLIRQDARIISKALATSLEYGLKINIAVADYNLSKAFHGQSMNCRPTADDIIYLGTNTKNQQQILTILDGRAFYAKFSASP